MPATPKGLVVTAAQRGRIQALRGRLEVLEELGTVLRRVSTRPEFASMDPSSSGFFQELSELQCENIANVVGWARSAVEEAQAELLLLSSVS